MKKRLAINPSEYEWKIIDLDVCVIVVTDPRDGEQIIHTLWEYTDEPDDDQKKMLLNIYLRGFHHGTRHGAEKKVDEIKKALGVE